MDVLGAHEVNEFPPIGPVGWVQRPTQVVVKCEAPRGHECPTEAEEVNQLALPHQAVGGLPRSGLEDLHRESLPASLPVPSNVFIPGVTHVGLGPVILRAAVAIPVVAHARRDGTNSGQHNPGTSGRLPSRLLWSGASVVARIGVNKTTVFRMR